MNFGLLALFLCSAHAEVTIGVSTIPYVSPLDTRINLEFPTGSLREFFEAISRNSKLEFTLVQGLGKCRVAAFVQNLTLRELLQMLLGSNQGTSYQQLGRSNHYTITRSRGGPLCPPKVEDVAKESCTAGEGTISFRCKNGSLASLAKILHDQSGVSVLVWNEATQHSISLKAKKASLEKVLGLLKKERNLKIFSPSQNRLVISLDVPIPERYEGSDEWDIIGSTPAPSMRRREEPPANPTYVPRED